MKNSISILSIILGSIICQAHADSLDEHLAKMSKVIEKDDRCEFAVASIPKQRDQKNLWPRGAVCVGTTVSDKGTMREVRGCTAFFINANNLMMEPLMPQLGYNRALNKQCDSGGFQTIMEDLLFTDNTAGGKKVPVKWAFTSPFRLPDSEFDVQLIFTYKNNKSYQDWFNKERLAYLADQKSKSKSK